MEKINELRSPTKVVYDINHMFNIETTPSAFKLALRREAREMATLILQLTKSGEDQDQAISYLRKAIMMAESSIDLNGMIYKSQTLESKISENIFWPIEKQDKLVGRIYLNMNDYQILLTNFTSKENFETAHLQKMNKFLNLIRWNLNL